jgi:hypothetical protein
VTAARTGSEPDAVAVGGTSPRASSGARSTARLRGSSVRTGMVTALHHRVSAFVRPGIRTNRRMVVRNGIDQSWKV